MDVVDKTPDDDKATPVEDMSLLSITNGENDRGIPYVKFIEDVDAFANTFSPPASAELLIGAYSELHSKFKTFETSLSQKKSNLKQKIPDIEKSLSLVRSLLKKKEEGGGKTVTRYNLADDIYGKAEIDPSGGIVNLWLGANVMLEFSYEEAIDFLSKNLEKATKDAEIYSNDLAFVRDQIVTSEVAMTRIYNWDVRKRRQTGDERT